MCGSVHSSPFAEAEIYESLSRDSYERRLEATVEGRASIRDCRARSRIRRNARDISEHALDDSKSSSRCG